MPIYRRGMGGSLEKPTAPPSHRGARRQSLHRRKLLGRLQPGAYCAADAVRRGAAAQVATLVGELAHVALEGFAVDLERGTFDDRRAEREGRSEARKPSALALLDAHVGDRGARRR